MKRAGATLGSVPHPEAEPLTDAERAAIERGEADAAAGRVVPHEKVRRWLRSLGMPNELPAPRWRK